ncbi:DUF4956 domain-containing protein [Rothia mucilaginosa]
MTILTMAIADAVAIAALCTLYMVRHRNRELMISYAVINAGIFTVSVALVSAGSNASAMGMGLFGVLSIIRLRSTALSQREVGYYFVALSVGMIAGVNISPAYIAFGLMATLVGLIAILDSRSTPVSTEKTQTVTADRAISHEEELKAYLSARLGYTVTSAKIIELDMVNNLTRATVTYQSKETTEGGTPAAVEATQAHVAPISAVAQPVAPQMTATRQPVAPTAEAHTTLDTRMVPLQRTLVGK